MPWYQRFKNHKAMRAALLFIAVSCGVVVNYAWDKGDKPLVWVFAVLCFSFTYLSVSDFFEDDADE
jgi:hypothetical protein